MVETTATPERVWMTYEDAEKYTSYERTTIWRAVRQGKLRQGGVRGAPRFEKAELDRWLRGEEEK